MTARHALLRWVEAAPPCRKAGQRPLAGLSIQERSPDVVFELSCLPFVSAGEARPSRSVSPLPSPRQRAGADVPVAAALPAPNRLRVQRSRPAVGATEEGTRVRLWHPEIRDRVESRTPSAGAEVRLVRPRPRWARTSPEAEVSATVGKLRAAQRKRVAAIRKLNARHAGQAFPTRAIEKWNRLRRELDETEELITELRARGEQHDRAA